MAELESDFADAELYDPAWMRPDATKNDQMLGARAELDQLLQKLTTTIYSDISSDMREQIDALKASQEVVSKCSSREQYMKVSYSFHFTFRNLCDLASRTYWHNRIRQQYQWKPCGKSVVETVLGLHRN
jgi:hypothetical protein